MLTKHTFIYLSGEHDSSDVGVDCSREALGGSGDHENVGDPEQRDEHHQRLGRLAVLLRLHRVGRAQLCDQHLPIDLLGLKENEAHNCTQRSDIVCTSEKSTVFPREMMLPVLQESSPEP